MASSRLYHAEFQVTVNPHVRYRGPEQFAEWRRQIIYLVENDYSDRDVLKWLFGGIRLASVNVYPVGVEYGARHRQIHFHFNVLVSAREPIRLRGLNGRHQDFFSEKLGIRGTYAHVSLVRGRAVTAQRLNYAAQKAEGPGRSLHAPGVVIPPFAASR